MPEVYREKWSKFWFEIAPGRDPSKHWQNISTAYSEPWRAYHNINHIGDCLAELQRTRHLTSVPKTVEAAIWFHDIVYDTHRKDNEQRSADFAQLVLKAGGVSDEFVDVVRSLILATRHVGLPQTLDEKLMVDIDLSILGQNADRYGEFERQIRAEYSWVSERDFAKGRSMVLQSFLDRQSVYNLPEFSEKYEFQARRNLIWAIAGLNG